MRNLIATLIVVFTLFTFTSCDTYAQGVVYDDGVVYEYSYGDYPVRYISGIPYYYYFVDNVWRWIILPDAYRPYIIHHHRPMVYNHHHNYYRGYVTRPIPHGRPNIVHHHSYPDRRGGMSRPNSSYSRPTTPGSFSRPNGFGRGGTNFGGQRGGNFNHSSSRGRR